MMVETRATHLDLGVRLQAEPLGDGSTRPALSTLHPFLTPVRRYSPVLAGSLGEDALRPETLLGRLHMRQDSISA